VTAIPVEGFESRSFENEGQSRTVYWRGTGPGVLVMHEIPGITPLVAAFGRRLADAGFRVAMPDLFGTVNKPPSPPYVVGEILKACLRREFQLLAKNRASPITSWLRALCRELHSQTGGPGVGAIGMCLTGNFALALMVDPCMMAPALSQPSLPVAISPSHAQALHMSPEALAIAKDRCAKNGVRILGMRFSHDSHVPAARFERLRCEFGDAFEGIEIDSGPGNPHGLPRSAHSVVTEHLVDEQGHPTRQALDRLFAFFAEQLKSDEPAP